MKPDPMRLAAASYPFEQAWPTRFADTDAVGHLNNVAVTRYHDNAVMAFQQQLVGAVVPRGQAGHWHVARSEASLLREAFYPQPIEARVAVAEVGGDWFSLAHALFQEGQCGSTGDSVIVLLDAAGEPLPLPSELRTALAHRGWRR